MMLLMFMFSLLGMQIFGGHFTEENGYGDCDDCEEYPRFHFDYFAPAMTTVFLVFTGAWVDSYQLMADVAGEVIATAYYVAALVIGFFIIMNLFVAILLESFAEEEKEEKEEPASMETTQHTKGGDCHHGGGGRTPRNPMRGTPRGGSKPPSATESV